MKQLRFALIFCLLFCCNNLQAQIHFLNGSIEPLSSSSVDTCSDNPFYKINTIGWDYMTIIGPQTMYVATVGCGLGAPEDGAHYIGLHYSPALHKGNQLLLQLSAPMSAGQTYRFSFYYKGPRPAIGSGTDLYYGFGTTDSTADTAHIDAYVVPDTVWQLKVVSVTPSMTCSYVWVGAVPLAGKTNDTGITYVDNFIFNPTEVEEINTRGKINLYPNPCHELTLLTLDAEISLPAKLAIYDITGRIQLEKDVFNRNVSINRGGIPDGMYFLKIVDNNHNIYTTKLIAN